MHDVMQSPRSFYTTPQGLATAARVAAAMRRIWPMLGGLSVLGVGDASACLAHLGDAGTRRLAASILSGPPAGGRADAVPLCVADECSLPFCDGAFDRLVLVHALRARTNPLPVLREASRVMKDDGRLLLAIPSRLAGRTRLRGTPFAADTAWTRGGIRQALAAAMLRPERWDEALFLPVWPGAGAGPVFGAVASLFTRLGGMSSMHGLSVDRVGRLVCPGAAGVILVEAVRDVYCARPVASGTGRRWLSRVVMPAHGAAREHTRDDTPHGLNTLP
ncbi:MAG: methyltransferase domain-containing protein [Acetobacter sp.]|uniref:class I SAM-dependent methyltransferase n=1 Tax=Acetobacter sp. TaxID=440 RepID=UPI0039E89C1C